MAEFIEKWKNALQKKIEPPANKIVSTVSAAIEPYNLINRINELESWKDQFADPNIRDNIDNINDVYTKAANIKNQIETQIVPNINNALENANKAAIIATSAENDAVNAADIAKAASSSVNKVASEVKETANTAITASNQAKTALTEINNIYIKLTRAANSLASEASKMTSPINTIISYIGYLDTDLKEIKESLRIGWFKLPDPIGAAIHVGEAIYHLIVINSNMKAVLTGFKDRLFPSMKNSLT